MSRPLSVLSVLSVLYDRRVPVLLQFGALLVPPNLLEGVDIQIFRLQCVLVTRLCVVRVRCVSVYVSV